MARKAQHVERTHLKAGLLDRCTVYNLKRYRCIQIHHTIEECELHTNTCMTRSISVWWAVSVLCFGLCFLLRFVGFVSFSYFLRTGSSCYLFAGDTGWYTTGSFIIVALRIGTVRIISY